MKRLLENYRKNEAIPANIIDETHKLGITKILDVDSNGDQYNEVWITVPGNKTLDKSDIVKLAASPSLVSIIAGRDKKYSEEVWHLAFKKQGK